MLINILNAGYELPWSLVVTVIALSVLLIVAGIYLAIKAHQGKIVSGAEGLIGSHGIVISHTRDKQPLILILGEIWDATSTHPLALGEKVRVTHINEGLVLHVTPITKEQ